jgi:hypothetical protein
VSDSFLFLTILWSQTPISYLDLAKTLDHELEIPPTPLRVDKGFLDRISEKGLERFPLDQLAGNIKHEISRRSIFSKLFSIPSHVVKGFFDGVVDLFSSNQRRAIQDHDIHTVYSQVENRYLLCTFILNRLG